MGAKMYYVYNYPTETKSRNLIQHFQLTEVKYQTCNKDILSPATPMTFSY